MQKRQTNIPEVVKPVLTGSWHGRDAYFKGFKLMLSILFVSVIYLILSLLLSFDSLALRIITSVTLVALAVTYLYSSGAGVGTADAAYGEIMYLREQEGRTISMEDRQRCFHPAKGFFVVMIGVLPYFLHALTFALLTKPETYTLGVLPSWMKTYARQSGIGDALAFYQSHDGLSVLSILRVVIRCITMPFFNVAVLLGKPATLLAERLSPLWVLLAPMGYAFGYKQGIKVRTRINTGIAIGDSKKKRRERKEHRARTQKQKSSPERLI